MRVLDNLQPAGVFRFFEDLCNIPHGSGNTKAVSDYLVEFAKNRGLKYRQDELNNVLIWKDASKGYENAPTVMIQGHMDMVCEKEESCSKDFLNEGLDLFIEGDLLGAKGTTLGGDDGIAVAMGLAVLDDDTIEHGPLECVFTVDEEIGLLGAEGIDTSDLHASYLLNIDSETEKVFTVSCAGGACVKCTIPVVRESFEGQVLEVSITGLAGGHSGAEIHLGRANANVLLGRLLHMISAETATRLISLQGGAKDNAIPRSAAAKIVVSDEGAAKAAVQAFTEAVAGEYRGIETDIQVAVSASAAEQTPMDKNTTDKAVCFLFCIPNGVQAMSADVEGLVQTSSNLGKVYVEDEQVVYSIMPRSSVNSQKLEVIDRMRSLITALGGSIESYAHYSAWEYRPDSELRRVMVEAFREIYKEEPRIEAMHAGLECGIFSEKMPGLDCISFGPELTDIHTPRERLHIASEERVWKLLLETLKRLH